MIGKSRCCGRVEFLACLEEIMDLLGKGHFKSSIYKLLRAENKMSISYRSFCLYLRKHNESGGKNAASLPPAPVSPSPAPAPAIPGRRLVSREEKFDYKGGMQVDDMTLFGADVLNKQKEKE